MIAATEKKSNTSQNDVTEKLGERVQNINYWKFELERGIQGKHSRIRTGAKIGTPLLLTDPCNYEQ